MKNNILLTIDAPKACYWKGQNKVNKLLKEYIQKE